MKRILLFGILCLIFTGAIIFEVKGIFGQITKRQEDEMAQYTAFAKQTGQASVSIDEIITYPDVEGCDPEGEVVRIDAYGVNVKVNGILEDNNEVNTGLTYFYTSSTDHTSKMLSVTATSDDDEGNEFTAFSSAISEFWFGKTDSLVKVMGSDSASDVEFFQCKVKSGKFPVIHNKTTDMWTILILYKDTNVIKLEAPEPFIITSDKATAHFSDPSLDPYRAKVYSYYESNAAQNTIKAIQSGNNDDEMLNEGKSDQEYQQMYSTGSGSGGVGSYTTKDDNNRRKEMAKLSNYAWKADGTSSETSAKIDISSEEAKKSLWKLSDETYDYTVNDITINNLQAKRNQEQFYIEGILKNNKDTERPCVLIIKYLNSKKGLLGISVIDKTENPIAKSEAATFNCTVSPTNDHINVAEIDQVMFEVY